MTSRFAQAESVQRRASRLALRQKRGDMSYEEGCNMLHWPSLSSRRTYFSLVECFKIVFGLSHLDFEEFIPNYLDSIVLNTLFLTMSLVIGMIYLETLLKPVVLVFLNVDLKLF